jgi:hypothetical protein
MANRKGGVANHHAHNRAPLSICMEWLGWEIEGCGFGHSLEGDNFQMRGSAKEPGHRFAQYRKKGYE